MDEKLHENEIVLETDEVHEDVQETIQSFSENNSETDIAAESEGVTNDLLSDDGISLYSAYDGSISSTYVEYFRGFASKLSPNTHYLFYRDGQYTYVFYYSTELSKEGTVISGFADYYRLDVRNGYYINFGSQYVSEDVTQGMYYSDFSGCPSLLGGDYYATLSLCYAVCVFLLVFVLRGLYKLAKHYRKSGI